MAAQALALEPTTSRYRAAYTAARDAARDAAGGGGGSGGRKTRHHGGEQGSAEADKDDGVLSLVWVDGSELEQAVASAFGSHVLAYSHVLASSHVLPSSLLLEGAHWDGTMGWQGKGQRKAEGSSQRDCDEDVAVGTQAGRRNALGKGEGACHGVPQVVRAAAPALLQDEEDGEPQAAGEEERSLGTGRDQGPAGHANDVPCEQDGISDGIVFLEEGEDEFVDEVEEAGEEAADGVSRGAPAAEGAAQAKGGEVQDVAVEGEDYYEMYVPPVHPE
jgi:hypothetical protein